MHRKVKEVVEGCSKFTAEQLFPHIPGSCPYTRCVVIEPSFSRHVHNLPLAILVHMKWYGLRSNAASLLPSPLLHVAIT